VLDALLLNTRVEVLYIQNFENGFGDSQLEKLTAVLQRGHIWAVNVGENFHVSLPAWRAFAAALPSTNVQYMYASEHHFLGTTLKKSMRDAIRANREAQAKPHAAEVVKLVGNMWFNPRKPGAPGPSGAARACDEHPKAAAKKLSAGTAAKKPAKPAARRRVRIAASPQPPPAKRRKPPMKRAPPISTANSGVAKRAVAKRLPVPTLLPASKVLPKLTTPKAVTPKAAAVAVGTTPKSKAVTLKAKAALSKAAMPKLKATPPMLRSGVKRKASGVEELGKRRRTMG